MRGDLSRQHLIVTACVENSERRGKNWPVESVELRWKSEVTQLN